MSQILISIKCFLGSSAGFRAISNIFQILKEWILPFAAPAFTTIRQWLLKIGLYQLTRPKQSSQGWFFIIDTSIQMGPQKFVVVLGIKKLDLNKNFCPTLEECEPIIVRPLYACSGEMINEILEEAIAITGVSPLSIISDEGSEIKKGTQIFSDKHPETIHSFDISHKINLCLKKELNNDLVWIAFKTAAAASIQNLKLSSIAYLAPPRQRSKDRMHSAFYLIDWGLSVLQFLDSEKANALTCEEKSKIEWLRNYQFALSNYMCLKDLCREALNLIHEEGYYLGVENKFIERAKSLNRGDLRSINFQNKIKAILQQEGEKIPEGAHYLGSSEIIESLFGKFKAIEGDHASSGLTSLVLAIPALAGKLNDTTVMGALETISVQDIERWNEDNLGKTFLSRRRHALSKSDDDNNLLDLDICD